MKHPKHSYTMIEILKNNRIGQSMTFRGHRTPEEVKENIQRFKYQLDNADKICILAVVEEGKVQLPKDASQQEHEMCVLNLIKKEEIYYLGTPLDKNSQVTQDPSKIASVRIGRYIQSDFKPGDYIIHPQTGEIFGHFGTATNVCRHKVGTQATSLQRTRE